MSSGPEFNSEMDQEWRSRLTELQYHVTREAGTERPNSGKYYLENRTGEYKCICCVYSSARNTLSKLFALP